MVILLYYILLLLHPLSPVSPVQITRDTIVLMVVSKLLYITLETSVTKSLLIRSSV